MRASSAAPAGAALLAFAGLAAYSGRWLAAARSPATLSLRAERADAADAAFGTANSADWWVYKVTYPSVANQSAAIIDLINGTLAPVETTCLGCDGVKMYATLGDGVGLHWVEAPVLTTGAMTLDEQVLAFDGLLGDTFAGGAWNAFMHNRVQMYTGPENFALHYQSLKDRGQRVFLRKSTGYSGYGADGTLEVAHVSFALQGHVYEIAAPIHDDADLYALTKDWKVYGKGECAAAMRLPRDDLEELDDFYSFKVSSMAENSALMQAWVAERGFAPPVLLDVQVASASAQATVASWIGVSTVVNMTSTAVVESDECVAQRVAVGKADDAFGSIMATVTYVENRLAAAFDDDTLSMDVTRYDAYVEAVHEAARSNDGFGWGVAWDHYLDQHVGFEYLGSGSCKNDTISLVETLDAELRGSDLLVANRQENLKMANRTGLPRVDDATDDDDNMGLQVSNHFYCGKWGSMTWEYNVAGCEGGIVVETNVCTCIPENSDRVFLSTEGSYCEKMTGGCPA